MSLFHSLILAVIQGVTEFLPISSSGHLNLAQHFLGFQPSLTFDIFLNTATLFSVFFFFRKQLKYFFDNLIYILIGSLPAALVGILLKDQVEMIFGSINLLPYFFLLTTVYLFVSKYLPKKDEKLTLKKAVIIGFFQAIAILPAVSRSGSTIFAGLLVGLSAVQAFNFSFCLFIIASLGALLLDFKNLHGLNVFQPELIIGFFVTFLVGIGALALLNKILANRKLWYFSFYTLLLAIILFLAFSNLSV